MLDANCDASRLAWSCGSVMGFTLPSISFGMNKMFVDEVN